MYDLYKGVTHSPENAVLKILRFGLNGLTPNRLTHGNFLPCPDLRNVLRFRDQHVVCFPLDIFRIIIAISAFRDSTETNASALYKEIVHSFTDMQSILLAAKL